MSKNENISPLQNDDATATTRTVKCPKCDGEIILATDAEVGEIITCDECSAELEVKNLDPVELDDAPEVQEDWGE
ncbi:lysine biosynthesis protein LysW [Candidatus Gracilibacteria bacterium]|nr:lysine biosynthesis protein LysW [Candidatus Gracilibacteria bacterium]